MKQDAQVVLRLPSSLAEWLRSYAGELAGEVGVPVSLAAVTRMLVEAGIAARGRDWKEETGAAEPAASVVKKPVAKRSRKKRKAA